MTSLPTTTYPIQDTDPFIRLDYHTVPLLGKHIKRNELGKKYGYSFPSNWQEVHTNTLNKFPSPIGGLLTSELVAIDCDCEASYRLFRKLDPTYQAYFDSIGKINPDGSPINCGTILYQHSPDLPPTKKLKGELDLDWFNGTGMVFLPTESNETKTYWQTDEQGDLYNHNNKLVEFKPMPAVVKQVLELALSKDTPKEKTTTETRISTSSKGYLAIQLENIKFDMGEYEPLATRILSPREVKDSKQFKAQRHLHPAEATEIIGRQEYLFKIMCHLAGDNTVDRELALLAIMWFNSMLDPPRSAKQMHSEIIDGILSGRQKNPDGNSYWQYDEHWEDNRSFTAISKRDNDLLHIFYDLVKKEYFVYNTVTHYLDSFKKKGELMEHIHAISVGAFNQKEAISDMENIETLVEPKEDFGYMNEDTQFNLFKPTNALRILADPSKHDYKEPTEFIRYIENFIPTEEVRTFFLRFIRTKLTTFGYTAITPFFIGVSGSGKGLFMSILTEIVGRRYVNSSVSPDQYMGRFNDWREDKLFCLIDEVAEGITSLSKFKGVYKRYSGSEYFLLEPKGVRAREVKSISTDIMASNRVVRIGEEKNDRRVFYINTPNVFREHPMFEGLDSAEVAKTILRQVDDIAYYLATEYENLALDEYTDLKKPSEDEEACMTVGANEGVQTLLLLAKGDFEAIDDLFQAYTPIKDKTRNDDIISTKDIAEALASKFNSEWDKELMKMPKKSIPTSIFKSKNAGTGAGYNLNPEGLVEYKARRAKDDK